MLRAVRPRMSDDGSISCSAWASPAFLYLPSSTCHRLSEPAVRAKTTRSQNGYLGHLLQQNGVVALNRHRNVC
jgi:hypothetical protein